MRLLASIVLALISLTPIKLTDPHLKRLEQYAVGSPELSQHHLLKPAPDRNLARVVKTGSEALNLAGVGVLAADFDSGQILFEHNSTQTQPIASITKLATVLVILRSHSMNETITVPTLPTYLPEDAKLGLVPGEQFRLKDLLKAALIPSDNDAADTLAIQDSGTIAAFSDKMNALVAQWGIEGAHFTNANGLSSRDNFASPQALFKLAKLALNNPDFAATVRVQSTEIQDTSGKSFNLQSTNLLLSDPRFSGLKTGFTAEAGQCLVTLVSIKGHRVITVVLNSPDRFGETAAMVDWIERNYQWF